MPTPQPATLGARGPDNCFLLCGFCAVPSLRLGLNASCWALLFDYDIVIIYCVKRSPARQDARKKRTEIVLFNPHISHQVRYYINYTTYFNTAFAREVPLIQAIAGWGWPLTFGASLEYRRNAAR